MEYYRRHPDKESTSDEMTVQIAAGGALASLDGAASCTSESWPSPICNHIRFVAIVVMNCVCLVRRLEVSTRCYGRGRKSS